MIFSFLEYFLRINSQKYENTITGSELVSWWKYLVLMELISLYLWSEGEEWVGRSCRANSYIIYLCNQSSQCTDQHNRNGPILSKGPFQHFFFCYYMYRARMASIWKPIILRQHANFWPCFLLVSLTPGALFVLAGRHLACRCPVPNSGTRDKCQFGIYL